MKTLFFLFLIFAACGQEDGTTSTTNHELVIGSGEIFETPDITAPSGAVVTILNHDGTPHTITSESAAGAFDNDGTFDVLVPSSGDQVLTLPVAPSGTIYFYYCRFHQGGMTPTDGTITIE